MPGTLGITRLRPDVVVGGVGGPTRGLIKTGSQSGKDVDPGDHHSGSLASSNRCLVQSGCLVLSRGVGPTGGIIKTGFQSGKDVDPGDHHSDSLASLAATQPW